LSFFNQFNRKDHKELLVNGDNNSGDYNNGNLEIQSNNGVMEIQNPIV
jgi:hypothetical protein